MTQNGDFIYLRDSIDFAGDYSCEYAYVIDLDENVLEAFKSIRSQNVAEMDLGRFAYIKKETNQTPVIMFGRYSLDSLPTIEKMKEDLNVLLDKAYSNE